MFNVHRLYEKKIPFTLNKHLYLCFLKNFLLHLIFMGIGKYVWRRYSKYLMEMGYKNDANNTNASISSAVIEQGVEDPAVGPDSSSRDS